MTQPPRPEPMDVRPIILSFTTLFPNNRQPGHGIFVENRLRHLRESGAVDLRVVAPVPWFPSADPRFGHYAVYAGVAPEEERHGVTIRHPRYVTLPKIGFIVAPWLLALGSFGALRRALRERDADVIDAHYFYPDGVAAALLGMLFNKPVVITARGTDIHSIPHYFLPRLMIKWAARRAAAVITVCSALRDRLIELGVPGDKVHVLRNGVALDHFSPGDRAAARRTLDIRQGRLTIASVGNLIEIKGHDLVIGALRHLPEADLLIAGAGPERPALEALAESLGVAERVRFLGAIRHDRMPDLYRAVDLLVLASSREGWANVLLEAMACGTPVVASNVWGTPEAVRKPEAGRLLDQRTSADIVAKVRELVDAGIDRGATRRYAEGFSWDATTAGQLDLFTAHARRLRRREVAIGDGRE